MFTILPRTLSLVVAVDTDEVGLNECYKQELKGSLDVSTFPILIISHVFSFLFLIHSLLVPLASCMWPSSRVTVSKILLLLPLLVQKLRSWGVNSKAIDLIRRSSIGRSKLWGFALLTYLRREAAGPKILRSHRPNMRNWCLSRRKWLTVPLPILWPRIRMGI